MTDKNIPAPTVPQSTIPQPSIGGTTAAPLTPPPSKIQGLGIPNPTLPPSTAQFPTSSAAPMPARPGLTPPLTTASTPPAQPPSIPATPAPSPIPPKPVMPPAAPLPPRPGVGQMPVPVPTPASAQSQPPMQNATSGSLPRPGLAPLPGQVPRPPVNTAPMPGPAAGKLPGSTGTPGAPVGTLPKNPTPATPPKSQAAEYKQSPLRFLPIILGVLLVLGLAFFIFSRLFGGSKTQSVIPGSPTTSTSTGGTTGGSQQTVTLNYWGLWEPNTVLQSVLSDFENTHPGIKVNYQQSSYQDYRERLQSAIDGGTGPDVFRFHASWTPMLRSELTPLPSSVMSGADFQNIFYPVATQQLTLNNQVMGIPLEYDGLALFYNSDALRAANAQPPKTWADLRDLASQLTIRGTTGDGKIQRAGLAIGNSTNVDNFSDIFGLLMLQNGADLTNPTSQAASDTLTFYTNFVKTNAVWSSDFPNSTTAFARGDVAMILAPSWRVHDIKAMNPNLKFGVAPVPQLGTNKITWASYWAEGVSSHSQHQKEAWQLIQYLSTPDVLRKLYSSASQQRTFGEIYSRKDMASDLANDPYVGPYVADAPSAQGWYLSSKTFDNGINDQLIKYYQDAVTAVINGIDPQTALQTVQQGTSQVLRQYGVAVPASTTSSTGTSTTR